MPGLEFPAAGRQSRPQLPSASVPRILALAAGCSVMVETAQYVLQLDRVSSVDDVLINTAGAGLAALASRRWWHTHEGSRQSATAGCGRAG